MPPAAVSLTMNTRDLSWELLPGMSQAPWLPCAHRPPSSFVGMGYRPGGASMNTDTPCGLAWGFYETGRGGTPGHSWQGSDPDPR